MMPLVYAHLLGGLLRVEQSRASVKEAGSWTPTLGPQLDHVAQRSLVWDFR